MFHTLQLRSHIFVLPLLAIVMAPAAFAATVVIPNAQETAEGNESNAFPFTRTATSNEPYRYQQVYNASGFGVQEAPITIDEIRFRPDSNNFEIAAVPVESIEVRLSTTTSAADGLDNVTFDNNIGAGATLVYSGPFTLPIPTVTTAPRPFEVVIPLSPQFVYDPSAGNLLVEIYNLSETIAFDYLLDQHNLVGDETSRVVEVVNPSTNEHLIPPIGSGSRGLVTQFVYNTPEAGALGTGVAACFALIALRRSRAA